MSLLFYEMGKVLLEEVAAGVSTQGFGTQHSYRIGALGTDSFESPLNVNT